MRSGKAFAVPVNEIVDRSRISYAGNSRLKIHGCDKLWGPWEGPHQVCQVSLAAREQKSIQLSVGNVSPAETELRYVALIPKPTQAKLDLYSPRNYQVFQTIKQRSGHVRRKWPYDNRRQ